MPFRRLRSRPAAAARSAAVVWRPAALRRRLLPAALAALLGAASPAVPAQAAAAPREYHVAPAPLGVALAEFAAEAGVTLSFDPARLGDRRSPGIDGAYTVQAGFARLLQGSGYALGRAGTGYLLVPAAPSPAAAASPAARPAVAGTRAARRETTLEQVNVMALVSDATTEGHASYSAKATTISGMTASLRETPQSVSVITRQRMDDQNMTSLDDAMQYATGMKVTSYGTGSSGIESRGYQISSYEYDGLPSLIRTYEGNTGLDMYDRIEVWRGPSGLLQGSGEPAGAINLVRKRALDQFALSAKASVGSWDNVQTGLDVTGPLDGQGTLRGRLVAADQNRDYFTRGVASHTPMFYGTLEYDITPSTTLSVGAVNQRDHDDRPFYGLSVYADGRLPDLPRSTYLGADWGRDTVKTDRYFAELENRWGDGGYARLAVNYRDKSQHARYAWVDDYIDPATGEVPLIPYYSRRKENELYLDARVLVPFDWLGLRQELQIGASYQNYRTTSLYNSSTYGDYTYAAYENVFHPDTRIPQPDLPLDAPNSASQVQQSLYAQARIKPWEPLTLVAGGRLVWDRTDDRIDPANDQTTTARFVPYLGVVGDIARDYSAYASYSSIFAPQSDRRFSGGYLPPRTGGQYEVGIKGVQFDQRLNTSLALYRIQDKNRSITDPEHPDFALPGGEVRSQGAEAEASGRLTEHWNLYAGYAFNRTRWEKAPLDEQGLPFTTTFPKHNLSLWTDYRFHDGRANGLGVAGGVKVSSAYYTQDGDVRWRQGGYALYAAQLSYQWGAHVHASLTVNNLFDKKYFSRVESGGRQVYYGDPRNFMFTVSYRL